VDILCCYAPLESHIPLVAPSGCHFSVSVGEFFCEFRFAVLLHLSAFAFCLLYDNALASYVKAKNGGTCVGESGQSHFVLACSSFSNEFLDNYVHIFYALCSMFPVVVSYRTMFNRG